MQQLVEALSNMPQAADAGQIAAAVLQKHKACCSAGMLVVWLLGVPQQPEQQQRRQQPQQQQLPLGFLLQEDATSSALAVMWHRASTIVHHMCMAVQETQLSRAAACEAALLLTEQLEEAGELQTVTCGCQPTGLPAVASAV
jgi:hypothetical protein